MSRGLRKELAFFAGLASAGLLLGRNKPLGVAMGLCAAGLGLLPAKAFSFRNRVAVITGGSRGLGLALAEQLLREGASVTLLARDEEELERASLQLQRITHNRVLIVPCDITQPEALERAFMQAEERFGRLDILINNAGSISVGPFETMDMIDFDAQLDLQIHAVIHAIRLALPAFERAGGGRVVNISSIGGQLPVPHMGTYCTAKFALAGLSETLAAELAPKNIHITTVYPGMMHTGSPIQAVFKGNHEKEYAWFTAGNAAPGISVSAGDAARKILDGVRHGDAQVSFPMATKIGIIGHAIFPETYALIMRGAARLMPRGESTIRKTGAQSQGWLERQFWYKPLRGVEEKAEARFNQREKFDANFNLGV